MPHFIRVVRSADIFVLNYLVERFEHLPAKFTGVNFLNGFLFATSFFFVKHQIAFTNELLLAVFALKLAFCLVLSLMVHKVTLGGERTIAALDLASKRLVACMNSLMCF